VSVGDLAGEILQREAEVFCVGR